MCFLEDTSWFFFMILTLILDVALSSQTIQYSDKNFFLQNFHKSNFDAFSFLIAIENLIKDVTITIFPTGMREGLLCVKFIWRMQNYF